MQKIRYILSFTGLFLFLFQPAQAQSNEDNTAIDQIVAVVNSHIILESEVDQRVRQYMYQMQQQNQTPSFNERLWYTRLSNMVEEFVLLEHAKIDSISVSDDMVDRLINQRIQQIIQQVGSEEALERQLGKSIIELRAELREQYRQNEIINRYRQQKLSSIKITRPEVVAFFETIPADSLPEVPEQVAVSQIVAIPPPVEEARQKAIDLAKALRDSIVNHGRSIEELAREYSDGPAAARGGKLTMTPIDDLVPAYAAAASALQPGEISKVVETDFGFHVIRLNKRQGDKIDTNHILIAIEENNYNDQVAIDKLNQIRDSVMTSPDITFAEKAREKSEDPNTSNLGGQLLHPQTGERLLTLEQLDPALYRIVLLLDEGDISEPKPFNVGSEGSTKPGYRIVRLDEQIPAHTASLETDYELIKNIALQQKRYRRMRKWVAELKEDVYVDYRIPVPSYVKKTVTAVQGIGNEK